MFILRVCHLCVFLAGCMRLSARLSDTLQLSVILPLAAIYDSPGIAETFARPGSASERFHGSIGGYGYVSRQRPEPVIIRVFSDSSFEERGKGGILEHYSRDVRDSNMRGKDLYQKRRSIIVAQELEQGVDIGQAGEERSGAGVRRCRIR